jgi:hypothetical protein
LKREEEEEQEEQEQEVGKEKNLLKGSVATKMKGLSPSSFF